MGRPDFSLLATPLVSQHLHDDGDAVDGDAVKGLQHGSPTELEAEVELIELELTYPLGFN